jgi:hypothetical protein
MFVQTIAWQHDRNLAASTAERASAAVALYGAAAGDAQTDAVTELRTAGIRNVTVSIRRDDEVTVVEIDGTAQGILVGTSARIHARSVTPTDRFDAP